MRDLRPRTREAYLLYPVLLGKGGATGSGLNSLRQKGAGRSSWAGGGEAMLPHNPHDRPRVFLAILSPAKLPEPEASVEDPADVVQPEPLGVFENAIPAIPRRF